MRTVTTTNVNCIRFGLGFGRKTVIGGMITGVRGDVQRMKERLDTRLYSSAPAAARAAAKHVVVRHAFAAHECQGQPSCQAHSSSRRPWRLSGPAVSTASLGMA
jgi:hypothetical protein